MTTAQQYLDRRWTALILLCAAQFIVVLDASIVNVALPSIGRGLHLAERNPPWVVNAYVIAFGGFLLLGGRAADLLGRRRVFMAGLGVVALASLSAGFAANQSELIAARAAQGLGAAIISPSALSIVTTLFRDGAERNRALGAWGAVAGSAGAAGVLLGGILTEALGWEWVLWVNVPVSLVALALAPGLLPESRSDSSTRHFDAAGAVSVTAGLSVLAYATLDASIPGWGSAKIVGLLALAVALIGAFVVIERRSEAPLVPFRIFRLRTVTGANVVVIATGSDGRVPRRVSRRRGDRGAWLRGDAHPDPHARQPGARADGQDRGDRSEQHHPLQRSGTGPLKERTSVRDLNQRG